MLFGAERLEYGLGYSESSVQRDMIDEGFTEEEIEYAMENYEANWQKQADTVAERYVLYHDSVSYNELVSLLENEGGPMKIQ